MLVGMLLARSEIAVHEPSGSSSALGRIVLALDVLLGYALYAQHMEFDDAAA